MVVLLIRNHTKTFVQFVNVNIISAFLPKIKIFFLFSTKSPFAFW